MSGRGRERESVHRSIESCYRHLAASVVERACTDYLEALRVGRARTISDCERFFRSEWFQLLSGGACDGEKAINALRIRRLELDAADARSHARTGENDRRRC